jgi:hypothetical protein
MAALQRAQLAHQRARRIMLSTYQWQRRGLTAHHSVHEARERTAQAWTSLAPRPSRTAWSPQEKSPRQLIIPGANRLTQELTWALLQARGLTAEAGRASTHGHRRRPRCRASRPDRSTRS